MARVVVLVVRIHVGIIIVADVQILMMDRMMVLMRLRIAIVILKIF